jgi:hypothetical protein
MEITRDVVKDLIPVYLAGEASCDTKKIVETYAAADPEIQRLIASAEDLPLPPMDPENPETRKTEVLRRTKRMIAARSAVLFLAILCTCVPFTMIDAGDWKFFMLRDKPETAAVSAVLAVMFWILYGVIRRRLQVTGL